MTMTDLTDDDDVMGPRGDRPKRRVSTASYEAILLPLGDLTCVFSPHVTKPDIRVRLGLG